MELLTFIVLSITLGALAVTISSSLVLRLYHALAIRRLERYQRKVSDWLTGYVVGARDDPPPSPTRNRFQRAVMGHNLGGLASELKGEASGRLASLFEDYGLVDAACRDLGSHRPLLRIRAADALGSMHVDRAVPQLREGLRHKDARLRLACGHALAELGEVDELPAIIFALREAEAPPGEIAEILLRFGLPATEYLRGVLRQDPDDVTRRLAAAALGDIRALEGLPELRQALSRPDDELVATAARALGRLGEVTAADDLIRLLRSDRTWFVHVAAANAVGALDTPVAAPTLAKALAAESWDLRDAAARALVKLGVAGFNAVLSELDELPDRAVAHYAGVLDMTDDLDSVIARAAEGDLPTERFVRRSVAASVRVRLTEIAAGNGDHVEFAGRLLRHAPAHAPVGAPTT